MSDSTQTHSKNNTGGGEFPPRLKDNDQWLVTQSKKPRAPTEGWQHKENLYAFTDARAKAEQLGGQLAFCFTEHGPFIGFDLDEVLQNEQFTTEALNIVGALDSYTEVSTSGAGLHVIVEGQRVGNRQTRGELSEAGHLEVYDADRYFVLTGDVYDGYTTVETRRIPVQTVQLVHLRKPEPATASGQQKSLSRREFEGGDTDATPEQVRRTIAAYVANENHEVGETVLRLWKGYDAGHPSPSEADMAYVKQLYFWCGGDQQLMDECFRASGRMRDKWDKVHSSDGATYGEMTIHTVCRTNSDTFEGRYVS